MVSYAYICTNGIICLHHLISVKFLLSSHLIWYLDLLLLQLLSTLILLPYVPSSHLHTCPYHCSSLLLINMPNAFTLASFKISLISSSYSLIPWMYRIILISVEFRRSSRWFMSGHIWLPCIIVSHRHTNYISIFSLIETIVSPSKYARGISLSVSGLPNSLFHLYFAFSVLPDCCPKLREWPCLLCMYVCMYVCV